jgi:hypothetical protein
LQEYLADTNPTDPNSLLRITAFAASAQATTWHDYMDQPPHAPVSPEEAGRFERGIRVE